MSTRQCRSPSFFRISLTISIHAPRGGSDGRQPCQVSNHPVFQSTLPVGGATLIRVVTIYYAAFQSTLPVGGATISKLQLRASDLYFNPRSPWGERPPFYEDLVKAHIFQSTLPVGGATCPPEDRKRQHVGISIHAPRGGSDAMPAPPGC